MALNPSNAAVAVNSIRHVVLASFIGTTIEWYDFFLYGTAAALVFNRLFFPTLDPFAGTMASFATYAVGFFARPVGGVVFGHFGDRMGRKSMLVTTLMLMGTAARTCAQKINSTIVKSSSSDGEPRKRMASLINRSIT